MNQDSVNVSIDMKALGQIISNDPQALADLKAGIQAGGNAITSQIGYANMGTNENPNWFSVYANSHQDKNPGDPGYLWRSRKGNHVVLRLKQQQQKNQLANIGELLPTAQGGDGLQQALGNNPKLIEAVVKALANAHTQTTSPLEEEVEMLTPLSPGDYGDLPASLFEE